jgi:2'-5' RNA ligase
MNNQKKQLFFIALIPPETVYMEVEAFKTIMSNEYNSSRALRLPPHITLIPPFWLNPDRLNALSSTLKEFSKELRAFTIHFNGFGVFKPKAIYIRNDYNQELMELQTDIAQEGKNLGFWSIEEGPFHPHMTIAFKDLTKNDFERAWNAFKERKYEADFTVSSLYLLRHSEKHWDVLESFSFSY